MFLCRRLYGSINQSINTLLTCCSLTSGVMAIQALPLAEARVIRTLAKAHKTVNTKENGVMPYKISPKISPKQYQNARNVLNPTICPSIRPYIDLLFPLYPIPGVSPASRLPHNPTWVEGLDPKPNPAWVRVKLL